MLVKISNYTRNRIFCKLFAILCSQLRILEVHLKRVLCILVNDLFTANWRSVITVRGVKHLCNSHICTLCGYVVYRLADTSF